jgi:membrane peptidoglycan carboxypeptidase
MAIIRVVDSEGSVIENNLPDVTTAAVPESVAADISSMLRDVVTEGTGKVVGDVPDAHGKTGTTNERRDIWFDGYTPELSTVVWACGKTTVMKGKGKNKHPVVVYPPLDRGSFGGTICGPIWARFMNGAIAIQRRYEDANRTVPEKTVPSDAAIAAHAGLKGGSPSPSPSPDTIAEPTAAPARPNAEAAPQRPADGNREPSPAPALVTTSANASDASLLASPGPAESPVPDVATPTPEPTPTPRARRPKRVDTAVGSATPEEERLVRVTLCPDSGQLATKWCPETVSRLVPASRVPRHYCRLHKPLPGDG